MLRIPIQFPLPPRIASGNIPLCSPQSDINIKFQYYEDMNSKEFQHSPIQSEVKDFSNLTGLFSLLYLIDTRNQQGIKNHGSQESDEEAEKNT